MSVLTTRRTLEDILSKFIPREEREEINKLIAELEVAAYDSGKHHGRFNIGYEDEWSTV